MTENNQEVELKACPFCKDNAYLQGMDGMWQIGCTNNEEGECYLAVSNSLLYPTKEEAIRIWNTRPEPEEVVLWDRYIVDEDAEGLGLCVRDKVEDIPVPFDEVCIRLNALENTKNQLKQAQERVEELQSEYKLLLGKFTLLDDIICPGLKGTVKELKDELVELKEGE